MTQSEHAHRQAHSHNGENHDHHEHEHGSSHQEHNHGDSCHGGSHADHSAMVEDFKRRFWVSLIISIPVILFSPMIQDLFGLHEKLHFPGHFILLFALSSAVYFYGGWPFLKGLWEEVSAKNPGMMTLIGVAITAAYAYSGAVVFGLVGKMFFWELVTLIDIMLLATGSK